MDTAGHGPSGSELGGLSFEQTLTLLAAGTVGLIALWLALVTVATAVEALCGVSSAALRAVTPAMLRRAVLLCCGIAAGAGVLSPAGAVSHPSGGSEQETAGRLSGAVLSGLPLPDRPVGAASRVRGRATVARPEPATPRYRVRPGDSLWSIAAQHLVGTPSPAEVDAAWRRLYHANRLVVGDDPDLLTTGSWLVLPSDPDSGRPTRGDDSSRS
ncbi:MAG TPA: LysM domain-containing protein [Nocardioidaceae bacterium]